VYTSTRPCTSGVYCRVDGRVQAVYLAVSVYTAMLRPCTRSLHSRKHDCAHRRVHGCVHDHVHGRLRTVYTPLQGRLRVQGPYTAVHGRYTPCTSREHGRVHGRARPVYMPVYTDRVHGRVRAAQTCTGPCARPCTAVYGSCTRPLQRRVTGREHGRVRAVYTTVQPCTWHTAVYVHGSCTRPCMYAALVHDCVHDHIRPCAEPVRGCVHGRVKCTRPVHGR